MNIGLYCNWGLKKYDNNYYIPSVHKNYIDVFQENATDVILLSKTERGKPASNYLKIDNVEVIELPMFTSYLNAVPYFFHITNGLYRLIKKSNFIYIRVPEPFSWMAGVLNIFSKTKLHYHYVSSPIDVIKAYKINKFIKYLKIAIYLPEYYMTVSAAYCNAVSCIGSSGKTKLPSFLQNKVLTLYEASYTKKFIPLQRIQPFYLRNDIKFLYVGRLVPSKGLEEMIESISILNGQTDYKFHLSIVGDGTLRTKIESLVKEKMLENKISFLGAIAFGNELDKIYATHDILISPSFSETGPRTVLEASSNSIYVISTNVGFVKEIFYTENQELCTLVKIGSILELVKAYKFIFGNKKVCYEKALSAQKVTQELTLNKFVKNILNKETS